MKTWKRILARVCPPILLDAAKRIANRRAQREPQWEYMPAGGLPDSSSSSGWTDDSILREQRRKWDDFVRLTSGSGPLGIDHHAVELSNRDYRAHNIIMTFGYVLALAARQKSAISILDWGSGLGHYFVFARALLPEVDIDYDGMDYRSLCEGGRQVLPEVRFLDTANELDRSYDLVVASGALQYAADWTATLAELTRSATSFFYVVTSVVLHAPSFVVVQRPHKYGYETELTQWIFNRHELVAQVTQQGFALRREFLNEEMAPIKGAPERGATVGLLFER